MTESFGAGLRRRRERQQVALVTIAEQTKINLSLLEALERDDVSHWPTGIFRRAFIRAYAHAIGLEPDIVVREFLERHPDPAEEVATVPDAALRIDGAPASPGAPTRLHYLAGSVLGSLSRFQHRIVPRRHSEAEAEDRPAPGDSPVKAPAASEPDLLAAADVCTGLGRLDAIRDAAPLLRQAAGILDAVGLIVWIGHPQAAELRPELAHGYSDKVLAQLPRVGRHADNATAAAFRSAQMCVVKGSALSNGALAVPLMTPAGCAGVLSIELQHGGEQRESVRALVTIFSAQLARVVGMARPDEAAGRRLA